MSSHLLARLRGEAADVLGAITADTNVIVPLAAGEPRTIIDALMLVPPDRVELLSASELATYGINALDAVALEEQRARSQFLLR